MVKTVELKKMYKDVVVPEYAKEGDAGMDIRAYLTVDSVKDVMGLSKSTDGIDYLLLRAGERKIIPTGLKVAIPVGYEIQVRPRSGMAFKMGVTVLNSPGTIDSGYRGEIGVIAYNASDDAVKIEHGERVAQIVLNKVPSIEWDIVEELDASVRGEGGFGSTGTN